MTWFGRHKLLAEYFDACLNAERGEELGQLEKKNQEPDEKRLKPYWREVSVSALSIPMTLPIRT